MATYFRRTGAVRRVDEHGDWGRASYLFEVHGRRVLRQIERYESGSLLRYGPARLQDAFGALIPTLPAASAIDEQPVPKSIFERAWHDGASHPRLGTDAPKWPRDEYRVAEPGEFPGLQDALAYVQADLDATMPNAPVLHLIVEPEPGIGPDETDQGPQVRVGLADGRRDGQYLQPAYYAVGEGADEYLTDAAQQAVMELGSRVWPTCPDHGNGLHVSRPFSESEGPSWQDSPEPVWLCRGGEVVHVVSRVGELSGSAGRRSRRRKPVPRSGG